MYALSSPFKMPSLHLQISTRYGQSLSTMSFIHALSPLWGGRSLLPRHQSYQCPSYIRDTTGLEGLSDTTDQRIGTSRRIPITIKVTRQLVGVGLGNPRRRAPSVDPKTHNLAQINIICFGADFSVLIVHTADNGTIHYESLSRHLTDSFQWPSG